MVANNLPFAAEAITAEKLQEKRERAILVQNANQNKNTFKYMVQNNMLGCEKWLTKMDKIYFGKCV